jgi:hypothetical protein
MVVVKDKVTDYGSNDQPGESQNVWNGVDIFVGCELGQDFEKWLFGS